MIDFLAELSWRGLVQENSEAPVDGFTPADRVDASHGPHFSSNILSLEAASQKLGVALALRPLVDYDIASMRLRAPFEVEMKPQASYFLVCPEVIADRPAVAAFRAWLLEQAKQV